ncbi:MAG TPA: metallophosphoesterase [Acidimicrobiales bacterium]|nr:metallophosphoesterase [Acidimicrobiales bacterium]
MTRIAAVGDIHVGPDSAGKLAPGFRHLSERADALLVAGDLTRRGTPHEGEILLGELAGVDVPIIAVLGNHDVESDRQDELVAVLEEGGVTMLDGTTTVVTCADGGSVGVAGVKGFGGGFAGACGTAFGERVMKEFVRETEREAAKLKDALTSLETDHRIALLHFSPIEATLAGERLEIFPFLGSYLLAEAVDTAGADLALHGHAHHGSERGVTPGGTRVRNVAQPVIGESYRVYEFAAARSNGAAPATGEVAAVH